MSRHKTKIFKKIKSPLDRITHKTYITSIKVYLTIQEPIMSQQKMTFQAEISKILDIVTHSLYSEREIFLRELISNASDASDKLRYLSLTQKEIAAKAEDFKIVITVDTDKKTLTIADNGIGMNREELIENLGTIAKSGTSEFLSKLKENPKGDISLIGQFGVGFYSSFMVADKVDVLSKKAGEEQAWKWSSTGKSDYTIAEGTKNGYGTTIRLHLKSDAAEFLERTRLDYIIKKYSDHISIPVIFTDGKEEKAQLNQGNALWMRSKSEITPEQYAEFYRHTSHHFDDPALTLHWRAEGKIEYTSLLFIPTQKPFDLFQPDRKTKLKLYVNRVFISDDIQDLLPPYLRFVQGVVDSSDLPLNVSREMLQNNPVLAKIKAGLVTKILSELEKLANNDSEKFKEFYEQFGAVLKEGLYEDQDHKDKLLSLARFASSQKDTLISLDDYVSKMKKDQESIYYLSGESKEALLKSPHLEGFKAQNIDVLLLTDPVDEFWIPMVGNFKDKTFKSITRSGDDLSKLSKEPESAKDKEVTSQSEALVAFLKVELKDHIKDVRTTTRLVDSLAVLASDEGDMDIYFEKLMKHHQKLDIASKRILEINPKHPLIKKLTQIVDDKSQQQLASNLGYLILDSARILEGETVVSQQDFQRRMADVMLKAL